MTARPDPPPFRLRAGAPGAPLVFVCDHASCALPARLGGLGLSAGKIGGHIGWDPGAAPVTELLAAHFDAPAAWSGYSRLAIDCNRDPEHPTSILEESDGVPVPGNRNLDSGERERRRRELFEPYHRAVAGLLDGCGPLRAFVAVHSFTPEMGGVRRPWHVGVLWRADAALAQPLLAALGETPGVRVGDNRPYSARDGRSYTTSRHAEPRGIPHVGLEIRNDLIRDGDGQELWAARIAAALERALAG